MKDINIRLSPFAGTAVAGVLFIMLTMLALYPLWYSPGKLAALPAKDPLLNSWIISSITENLEQQRLLFDGRAFYPSRGTLTYSEHLLGYLPISWPMRKAIENSLVTVNILTVLTFPLAGLFMFLLVRYLTGDLRAAFTAGAIFAFAPYRMAHLMHLNLLSVHWIPLILLYWHRSLLKGKAGDYSAFILLMVVEILSCVQYGIYFLFLLPLLTLIYLAKNKKLTEGNERFHWFLVYALIAAVIFPFFLPYMTTLKKLGVINTTFPNWSASALSFLTPCSEIHMWRWLNTIFSHGQDRETFLFPGLLAIYLSWKGIQLFLKDRGKDERTGRDSVGKGSDNDGRMVGKGSDNGDNTVRKWNTALRAVEVLMALTFTLIIATAATGGFSFNLGQLPVSIRSVSPISTVLLALLVLRTLLDRAFLETLIKKIKELPFEPYVYLILVFTGVFFSFYGPFVVLGMLVPPFASLRVSARFFSIALFGLSVLSGYGSHSILKKTAPGIKRSAVTALLVFFVMLESLSIPLPLESIKAPPPLYKIVGDLPKDTILLELPCEGDDINARYMYCSTFHRKTLVNGYSGIMPRYWEPLTDIMKTFPSRESIITMSIFGVGHVAVHYGSFPEEERERIRAGADACPELQSIWSDNDATLYRFTPSARSSAGTHYEKMYPVPRKGWKIEAIPDKGFMEGASNLIDGKLRSYWTNGRAVRKGDCINIDMGESHCISGICFFQGTDFGFYLRTYYLESSINGNAWELLARGYYDPPPFYTYFLSANNPYFFIPFPATEARYVRMRSTDNGNCPWTVHEVKIYGPHPSGEPAESLIPVQHRNSSL